MQTRAAHDLVHQERRARHVAQVFEQQDEQEQDQDLRQEHQHAADAGDDAVLDEALQQPFRQRVMRQHAEPVEAGLDQVHQRLRPGEHRLEHDEQQRQQDEQAGDRMQQHGVDLAGHRVGPRRLADRGLDDAIGLALRGAKVGRGRRLPGALGDFARAARRHLVDAAKQFLGAAAPHRGRGDHRHAELGRKLCQIDVDAAAARDVDHVEDEQHRPADALQFDHQTERHAKIGGVGDAEQKIGRALAGDAAEHDVAGDLLVGAAAAQRIGARQVDQIDAVAGQRAQHAGFALDGDAGIVRDLLPAAGQRIEQRGLAAVRRADQREAPCCGFGRRRHPNSDQITRIGHRLPASKRDGGIVDANRDRVAPQRSLVKDLDLGAFDKSEFEQAPLKLHRAQAVVAVADMDGMDVATKSAPRQSQRHAFRLRRRNVFGHAAVQRDAHEANSTGPTIELGQDKPLGMSVG